MVSHVVRALLDQGYAEFNAHPAWFERIKGACVTAIDDPGCVVSITETDTARLAAVANLLWHVLDGFIVEEKSQRSFVLKNESEIVLHLVDHNGKVLV